MITLKKIQENTCPFCGSDEYIDYEDSGLDDEYYYYELTCKNCNKSWIEWYVLTFKDIQLKNTEIFVPAGKEGFEYYND